MAKPINKYQKAVEAYLSELRFTGHADTTIGNYSRRLRYFGEFWASTDPEDDPDKDDVRAWRDHLLEGGMKPTTARQYMVELGTFFEWCVEDERYEDNPVTKRLLPKIKETGKTYQKVLGSDKLAALWENTGKGKYWPRNYAIITLLLDGKIRNAELLDMRLKDIDFKYSEVTIPKGKGSKSRVVTLSDISLSAIRLYLASGIRPDYCTEEDYLFGTTADGKRWTGAAAWHRGTTAWLSALVEKHVRQVTGLSGFRSHSMRHNGSIFDLNNGSSLERLQSELGHASVTTTELYAGRLGSRRHQDGFRMAVCARDYWAEKNKAQLEKLAPA